jgi:DNA-directed RNA polymerase specialized sigma24 family protein/CheY-like chemotaxis protein
MVDRQPKSVSAFVTGWFGRKRLSSAHVVTPMSLADSIAPHVPHLRRFARLLTGSQSAGDGAVARVLQVIAADPSAFPDLPPQLGLYQYFLRTFTRRYRDSGPRPGGLIGDTAARTLAALTPEGRQAFILVTVEGFSAADTAQILEVSERRVGQLLNEAGAEIGKQIATDVLIIEDEPVVALDLKHILEGLGHCVVAIARTHAAAVQAAKLNKPGLVIADIRLADGSSGLDAVNEMLRSFAVPVVFVTAFPNRLATGKGPEPTFLIHKPFREDAVRAIVSQVLFFDQEAGLRTPARSASAPS